ncbi:MULTISPECIES: recombinase family protein [unclassified Solwaraspora]|uniref:recombinase family protein n=1 Tax=unclassified Solwaraspora TaxID=2627926 RepID=UPI00248C7D2C|nr:MULTISPECIES: recombinase family protein [unclassified Solwaraspora]WBB97160.1 recombinase family protein [Solwaraspora sp. WMMA2059]WBC18938.1 recombinase family protein [Solwaraspora sp. WMMA2080]WJK33632.1 recombinase family protein [Solwaraspora sp. WMMA2065]
MVKPLMYGYLRVDLDALDGDIRQMELALKFWAEQEGYCLAGLFHEYDTALNRPALTALIEEIGRSDARRVITPSLAHLSTHPVVQRHLLDALEDTGVQVHTLQEELDP